MADNPESMEDVVTDLAPAIAEVGMVAAVATVQALTETAEIQPLDTEVIV